MRVGLYMNCYTTGPKYGPVLFVVVWDDQTLCNRTVNVYKNDLEWEYAIPEASYTPDEVFIGKSPANDDAYYCGKYGIDYDGNTILLRVGDIYVWLYSSIKKFRTLDKIIHYASPISYDESVPYAVDQSHNVYLLSEMVVMLCRDDLLSEIREYGSPTLYFMTKSPVYKTTIADGKEVAQKVCIRIGDCSSHIVYSSDPRKLWDEMVNLHGADAEFAPAISYHVVYADAKWLPVTYNGYLRVIHEYGNTMGFAPIEIMQ